MKRKKLLAGAMLLTLTGFVLRGLGMVLRVLMSSKLGEEGMGLYQLTQSVYFLFITVAQSGVSVALTRLMSARLAVGDNAGAQSVMTSALRLSLTLGFGSAAVMSAFSYPICKYWVGDMRCLYPIISLSWALPFIAVCGVITAYFIVRGNALVGCISQLIEQGVRIGVVVILPYLTLTTVTVSGTVAEALSCLFLVICYFASRQKCKTESKTRQIVTTAAPIAASRYLASALRTAENVLVPSAIAMYTLDRTEALSQFGALKGMALPLLFFPYSLLSAITTLMTPEVSGAQAKRDSAGLSRTVERVCSITLTLSVMAAGIFFTLSDKLGTLIYHSDRVSQLILWLAPIVPFMYLDSVCDGLLKGLGKQKQVLLHNSIDSAGRILLTAVFVPHFGIAAFAGVMVLSNISVSLMNFYTLCKTAGVRFRIFSRLLPPTAITVISSFLTNFLSNNGASALNTALECALFCGIFALFYVLFRTAEKNYKNKDKKHFILIN